MDVDFVVLIIKHGHDDTKVSEREVTRKGKRRQRSGNRGRQAI